MKLLRGRTSTSLIDLDLVTLIKECDSVGNNILTDAVHVEGNMFAWLAGLMNQYVKLYEAVAEQQHKHQFAHDERRTRKGQPCSCWD